MKKSFVFLVFLISAFYGFSQKMSLDGSWYFTLDQFNVGEKIGWNMPTAQLQQWERVVVPHCFSDDPKFFFYTGNAWYTRKFRMSDINSSSKIFIRFEAVFYRSKVFVNGKLVGEHEGGYTPFEVEVTKNLLKNSENTVTVKVDNSWDDNTIPGCKPLPDPDNQLAYSQFYPWINYGGIIRSVNLIIRPENYIKNIKIEAVPDLQKNTAKITIKAFLVNVPESIKVVPKIDVTFKDTTVKLKWKVEKDQMLPDSLRIITSTATVPEAKVKLWSLNYPNLYHAVVVAGKDTFKTSFGIRKLEIKGTEFLLNGEPLHLGGANRVVEFQGEGSKDPTYVVEKDLSLMKEANMVLSRIAHYPVNPTLLDWADKNGMLIIAETGNWQMTASQMASPLIRSKYRQQAREMIERDWNHPCIIAYSVGNEYKSTSKEGISWTKDMIDFSKKIDSTRKFTFCSNHVSQAKTPDGEGSMYVDFVSVNIYGNKEKTITKVHNLYPDKPIYISEFGFRTDQVENEEARIEKLRQDINVYRRFDYIMGASIWTFNHYRSRYPDTGVDGCRPWGVVDFNREKLKAYETMQSEFSPVVIEKVSQTSNQMTVKLTARNDFPKMILEGFKLRIGKTEYPIKKLMPGEIQNIIISNISNTDELEIISPTGFTIFSKQIQSF